MPEAPRTLYIAATKYRLWLGASPFAGDTDTLYLLAQCSGGPHDGSAIPLALTRENAEEMWPVLKSYAEKEADRG
jgi:hypothetical protein